MLHVDTVGLMPSCGRASVSSPGRRCDLRVAVTMICRVMTVLCLTLATVRVPGDVPNDTGTTTFTDGRTEYRAVQLMRYTLREPRWPNRAHFSRLLTGRVLLSDQYHLPSDPSGPLPVDCRKTRALGVTYLIRREAGHRHRRKTFDVRYVWSHAGLEEAQRLIVRERQEQFLRGELSLLSGTGLGLTRKLAVDGVVSVEAIAGDTVLFRNAFELRGCPEFEAPP